MLKHFSNEQLDFQHREKKRMKCENQGGKLNNSFRCIIYLAKVLNAAKISY